MIFRMSADGTYDGAKASDQDTVECTEHLVAQMDNSANMDW